MILVMNELKNGREEPVLSSLGAANLGGRK